MNNSPAPATKPSGQKLMLSAVLLAVIGLAVWGMVSAGKAPGVVQPGTQLVPHGIDSPAERNQEAALALERVILDPNSTEEQRRVAYEAKGDAAAVRGDFDSAFDSFFAAVTLVEENNQPRLWITLQAKAARMLRKLGYLRAAHELFDRVVRHSSDFTQLNAEALRLEGNGLRDQLASEGSNEDMLEFYRRVFAIHESALGANDPRLQYYLDSFARQLTDFEQHEEAITYFRRSLEITQAKKDRSPASLVASLESVKNALLKVNKIDEAVVYARQAVAVLEKENRPEDSTLASNLIELGELLQRSKSPNEADQMFQRAMEMELKLSVENRSSHLGAIYALGKIYHDSNRLAEAESLYRLTIEVPDPYFGGYALRKAYSLTGLSQILEDSGRLSDTEPLLRNAVRMQFRAWNSPFSEVADPLKAAVNYLRVARLLEISDEEIHRRLDEERGTDGVTKKEFEELWQDVLAKNPKEAVNEQPTPVN